MNKIKLGFITKLIKQPRFNNFVGTNLSFLQLFFKGTCQYSFWKSHRKAAKQVCL